jgi:CheY-like chemotaxis protein
MVSEGRKEGGQMNKRFFRLLIIEDDDARIAQFKSWVTPDVRVVVASSAGTALGILQRDRGTVYGGILLDHDLQKRTVTQMDKSLSGTQVIEAIISNVSPDVPILIHSTNSSGSAVMMARLIEEGFSVAREPMDTLDKNFFMKWLEQALALWEDIE